MSYQVLKSTRGQTRYTSWDTRAGDPKNFEPQAGWIVIRNGLETESVARHIAERLNRGIEAEEEIALEHR